MTDRPLVPLGAGAAAFARVRAPKSASAFRTISEVADQLDVPQHVLRFWETRFAQIRPLKRAGGRRYYRPEDVDLLRRIRELLYRDGYTIKGVQKLLRDNGRDHRDTDDDLVEAGERVLTSSSETPAPDLAAAAAPVATAATTPGSPSAMIAAKGPEAAKQALSGLIDELEAIREELARLRRKR